MLIYRIWDELYTFNGNTGEHVKVYDGTYGTPNKFQFKTLKPDETGYDEFSYVLVIITDYCVVINYGLPADMARHGSKLISCGIEDKEIVSIYFKDDCVHFLFSDLSCKSINYETREIINIEDGFVIKEVYLPIYKTDILRGSGEQYIRDLIRLPLLSIPSNEVSEEFITKSRDGKYVLSFYMQQCGGIWSLCLNNFYEVEYDSELIYCDSFEDEFLYIDGTLQYNGEPIHDVVKHKFDYPNLIVLRSNGLLEFLNDRYSIPNVDNFYFSIACDMVYIIKDDQLRYKHINEDREWKIAIEEGASRIIFPTDSYYDIPRSRLKSARK